MSVLHFNLLFQHVQVGKKVSTYHDGGSIIIIVKEQREEKKKAQALRHPSHLSYNLQVLSPICLYMHSTYNMEFSLRDSNIKRLMMAECEKLVNPMVFLFILREKRKFMGVKGLIRYKIFILSRLIHIHTYLM